jgi:uncharacterized repeat protein (TIGR02543 family)
MKFNLKTISFLVVTLLQLTVSFSQDVCAPVGWATQNGGTIGGGNATPITVSTLAELQSQANSTGSKVIYVSGNLGAGVSTRVKVLSNKTIIGLPGATLFGGFDVRGSNIIIRNMKVRGPGSVDVNGVDCISIDGATTTNVWIDHCELYDGQDGNMDITNGANFIAITWCKFYYTGASSNHQFCNLIGNSDTKTTDRGKLKVTMMYNWWTAGCVERMPRVRFGQVHVVNNLFDSKQSSTCVRAGKEADLRVESNYFDGVKNPIDLYQNNFTAVSSINNVFNATTGTTAGSGTAFTPPYSLSITPAANIKSIVTAGAGANLSSPTSCGGSTPVNYSLSTSASPTNGGTVTAGGSFISGTVVTLTATPNSGYTFTGWSGDASGTTTSVNVTMNSNKSVTANFAPIVATDYTLVTLASPSVGGTVTSGGTYASGSTVSLTATPSSGYIFTGWSGDASGTSVTTSVTMNANKTVTANFQPESTGGTATIRIEDDATTLTGLCSYDGSISTNSGATNGRVINLSNSIGRAIVWSVYAPTAGNYGLLWRYVNSSSSNSYVMALTVNGVGINSALPFLKTSNSTTFATSSINVSLQAGFNSIRLESVSSSATADIDWMEVTGDTPSGASCSGQPPITYTIATNTLPTAGGTVAGGGTYTEGTVVTLTASPSVGYVFTGWSGDASGTSSSTTVTMNSNKNVIANFSLITYTLSTSSNPVAGGTVTGSGTYNAGYLANLTATANSGYVFTGWSGDASGTSSSTTVTMNSNKNVTANFALITYTLSTSANPVAGGTVTGSGTYNAGSLANLTATANSGYVFTGWSGDASGTSSSVTVTMNANKSVTANFEPVVTSYTLSTAAIPSIGGTVTAGGIFTAGSVVSITATPNSGYIFVGWSGDASGTSLTTSITMNANKSVSANFQLQTTGETTTIRIEDNATSTTGLCLVEGSISSNSGANNGKVINLSNSTGKGVNWKVNVPSAGNYNLTWRYVNSSTSNSYTMALLVNGVIINSSVPFAKTANSTTFSTSTVTVSLNAGGNIVRLQSIASNATADIDWIEITGNAPAVGNCAAARGVIANLITSVEEKSGVYPNPARGITNIQLNIANTDFYTIKVLDKLGRLVENMGTKLYQKGTHQIRYNVNGKKSGAYIVQIISTSGVTKSHPFIVF